MDKAVIEKIMSSWRKGHTIRDEDKPGLCMDIADHIATLPAVGPFYYFVLNFGNLMIELTTGGTREVLGIEPDQFSIQKGFELIHPDDLAKLYEKESISTHFLFNNIKKEEILMYKIVYMFRLKHSSGIYKTILHQAIALSTLEDGKIQYILGIHTDVSHLHIPFNHNVSFLSTQRPSYYAVKTDSHVEYFESHFKKQFSVREKEIILLMSEGKNFNQIAEQLFMSPHTVNTHKKNILYKSGCKNTPELIAQCLKEGVI